MSSFFLQTAPDRCPQGGQRLWCTIDQPPIAVEMWKSRALGYGALPLPFCGAISKRGGNVVEKPVSHRFSLPDLRARLFHTFPRRVISTAIKLGTEGLSSCGPGNTAPGRGYTLSLRACRHGRFQSSLQGHPRPAGGPQSVVREQVLNHSSVWVDP